MNKCLGVAALVVSCAILPAAAIDLPVFYLKYDAGIGSDETEEEQEVEASSHRHQVSLRIKEAWDRALVTNLYTVAVRKQYLAGTGSYTYAYLSPDVSWDITDAVKWYLSGRSKWMRYDEPDAGGLSKDYISLQAKTNVTLRPHAAVKIIPGVQGSYEVYENRLKSRQSYTFALAVDARLGQFVLGADYRAMLRLPLGAESEVAVKLNNEMGIDVSWDPNP